MARVIRYAWTNQASSRYGSQGSASHGTGAASASDASQRNKVAPPQEKLAKKRGRKLASQTRLAQPHSGSKVALKPTGDMWVHY